MKRRGFSIIELIVSAAVGIFIITAVLALINDFMQSQNSSERVHDLLVSSESMVNQLTYDMHKATAYTLPKPAGQPGDNMFILHLPAGEMVIYSWLQAGSEPTRVLFYRNGELMHPEDVLLVRPLPPASVDFFQSVGFSDSALPLIKVKFTLEHVGNPRIRTIHETSTTISFRDKDWTL